MGRSNVRSGWMQRAKAAGRTAAQIYQIGSKVYDNYRKYDSVRKVLFPKKTPRKSRPGAVVTSPGGRVKVLRSATASSSKSAGFLKRGRKLNKNSRRAKMLRNGTYETLEAAGNVTATNCRYLGHATMPRLRVAKVVAQAIVKAIAMKLNTTFNDFEDQPRGFVAGDVWRLYYKVSDEPAAIQLASTYTAVVGTTWQLIADWLYNVFVVDLRGTGYTLISFEYEPAGAGSILPFTFMYLKNASIAIDSKSSIKIQNRSRNATGTGEDGNNADDIDNTPIHGYSYEGKGVGCHYMLRRSAEPSAPLIADPWGVITAYDDGDLPKEPPLPEALIGVSRHGKIHLDPGYIKTSVLTTYQRFALNTLMQKVVFASHDVVGVPNAHHRTYAGVWRLFACEKMINTSEVVDSIVLGFEHNLRIGAAINLKNSTKTNEIFVQKYY